LLEAVFSAGYGAKECGTIGWGLYFVFLLPLLWIRVPWTTLAPVIGFIAGGTLYRIERYHKTILLAAVVLAIASTLAGAANAPPPRICQPI